MSHPQNDLNIFVNGRCLEQLVEDLYRGEQAMNTSYLPLPT